MNIKLFLTNLFTEDDGTSFCIAKTMAAIAFVSYLIYAGYALFKGNFALHEYASGLMDVLAGSGAIIAGKQITQKN